MNGWEKRVEELVANWDACFKFGRNKPRSKIASGLFSDFNQAIGIDIMYLERHMFLVMVDLLSRLTLATKVESRSGMFLWLNCSLHGSVYLVFPK